MKNFLLYVVAGLLMGNGFRAATFDDHPLLVTVLGLAGAFTGLYIFGVLQRREERTKVETWLRIKGHTHVADRFQREFK